MDTTKDTACAILVGEQEQEQEQSEQSEQEQEQSVRRTPRKRKEVNYAEVDDVKKKKKNKKEKKKNEFETICEGDKIFMDWWMDEHNQEKIDALYRHVGLLGTSSGGGGDGTEDLKKIAAFYRSTVLTRW